MFNLDYNLGYDQVVNCWRVYLTLRGTLEYPFQASLKESASL